MGVLMSEVASGVEQPKALVYEKLIFWKEKLGYAVGDTASCLYWQTFSIYLFIFYTDTFGISAGVVGLNVFNHQNLGCCNRPCDGSNCRSN